MFLKSTTKPSFDQVKLIETPKIGFNHHTIIRLIHKVSDCEAVYGANITNIHVGLASIAFARTGDRTTRLSPEANTDQAAVRIYDYFLLHYYRFASARFVTGVD